MRLYCARYSFEASSMKGKHIACRSRSRRRRRRARVKQIPIGTRFGSLHRSESSSLGGRASKEDAWQFVMKRPGGDGRPHVFRAWLSRSCPPRHRRAICCIRRSHGDRGDSGRRGAGRFAATLHAFSTLRTLRIRAIGRLHSGSLAGALDGRGCGACAVRRTWRMIVTTSIRDARFERADRPHIPVRRRG